MTIWKYCLSKTDEIVTIAMPQDAQVLGVKIQYGRIALWALVDETQPEENRHFRLAVAGAGVLPKNEKREYLDTVLLDDDTFVLHIFELVGGEGPDAIFK